LTRPHGTQRLFDFLFSPHNTMPAASEMYAEALAWVERAACEPVDEVPF